MCGRYTLTQRRSDDLRAKLAGQLGLRTPALAAGPERFNIAPTQEVLAVVDDRDGRRIEGLRWGLIPSWANEPKTGFSMINARAETLHERAAYRPLVRRARHRCLLLADGWYEWQRPEDPRQAKRPLHFALTGGEPFCFAGLWTRWRSAAGAFVQSCTIITCAANALARPIHDRMPVVLCEPDAMRAWLDPQLDAEELCELLAPLPSERLVVSPANPVVNSGTHEGPDCLEVAAAA